MSIFSVLLLIGLEVNAQERMLLHHGHAHNDYKHKRPLFDALDNGFTSIEIDVYSYNGIIKVSHLATRLKRKPDIESLYLKPLKEHIEMHGGRVFAEDSTQMVLMIDLKSDKRELITQLQDVFKPYAYLVQGHNSQVWAPLIVVLSGRPPVDLVLSEENKLFRMEGSVFYNKTVYPADIMPRLGSGFKSNFRWNGRKGMSEVEQKELADLVNRANANGQKIRFWGSPDKESVWKTLLDSGVHWINVDNLSRFRKFYTNYRSEEK